MKYGRRFDSYDAIPLTIDLFFDGRQVLMTRTPLSVMTTKQPLLVGEL